jgi:TPR repeat protein
MATFYSPATRPIKLKLVVVSCFLAVVFIAVAAEKAGVNFLARAEKEMARTQKLFLADTNNLTNAWQFAAAAFDVAEIATNETHRATIAKLGIAASRAALARDPKSAEAHYYLAMNFGELAAAEAPSIAAYKLVHQIEEQFKLAANLDEKFDHAGPVRNLGQLYFQAPGWPLSVGSKHKAREWLERAVALAPDYPENQMLLAEAYIKWRQKADAEKTLHKIEVIWAGTSTNFPGEAWEKYRADWAASREKLRVNFQRTFND